MIVSKVLLNDLITNHIKQENGLNEVNFFDTNLYLVNKYLYLFGKAKMRTTELYLLTHN